MWKRGLGRKGERAAARFLRRRGYRVLQRNYHTPLGEIDILALDGRTLVFVEVKTRSDPDGPAPETNVTRAKQAKLTDLAKYIQTKTRTHHLPYRFDVIAVTAPPKQPIHIHHFIDAFPPTPRPFSRRFR